MTTRTPPHGHCRGEQPMTDPTDTSAETLLDLARRYVAAGLSILPLRLDGSKEPTKDKVLPRNPRRNNDRGWHPLQTRLPTDDELVEWFGSVERGMGMIAGRIRGNAELLDFDEPAVYPMWASLVEMSLPGLLARLPIIQTPTDGRHVWYRCPLIAGNQKLAKDPNRPRREQTLIETRGEGGYGVALGTPLATHALGLPYVQL